MLCHLCLYISILSSKFLAVTSPMSLRQIIAVAFFALALARVQLSTCELLKGSVSCLDCHKDYNFSGIKVLVRCNNVKKLAMATTVKDGSFKTELPSDNINPTSIPSFNCLARILGGPQQLYSTKNNMVSNVVKAHDDSYTISNPLNFYTSCPLSQKDGKCGVKNSGIGSSKTVDLPLPREWGLPPTSYYTPIIPIIGIP